MYGSNGDSSDRKSCRRCCSMCDIDDASEFDDGSCCADDGSLNASNVDYTIYPSSSILYKRLPILFLEFDPRLFRSPGFHDYPSNIYSHSFSPHSQHYPSPGMNNIPNVSASD